MTRRADLPFWEENFKDNLVNTELLAPAHSSRESDLEHSTKVATLTRKQYLHSLSERPKLRRLVENQNNESFRAEDALVKLYIEQKVW